MFAFGGHVRVENRWNIWRHFFLSGLLDLDHRLADGGLVSHNEILQKNL